MEKQAGNDHLLRIFYMSRAVPGLNREEIDNILATARERNAAEGFGGVLLYGGGYFVQGLEGRELPLLKLYTRIAEDPRHRDCVLLNTGPISKRIFDAWSMGYLGDNDRIRFDHSDLLSYRLHQEREEKTVMLMRQFVGRLRAADLKIDKPA
jgi:hypothetical protein